MKVTEGTFEHGDSKWYTKTWLPDEEPRARLVVMHGFSDHINRYYDFFPTLADRGIAVYGWDRRGWGRTGEAAGTPGRTGDTESVLGDMEAFLARLLDEHAADRARIPFFVLGHSMGGIDTATLMAAPAGSPREARIVRRIRGWLYESPFFGFPAGEAPSALKIGAGRLAGRLLPNMTLKHVIPAPYLSRDPAVVESIVADPLCHNTGTLEGFAHLLDRVGLAVQGGCKPGPSVVSIWLGHGTEDRGTSHEASEAWFRSSASDVPDATFRSYPGWYHQLHAEPAEDRALFYKEVGDWILSRAAPDGPGAEAYAAVAAGSASPAAAATDAKL